MSLKPFIAKAINREDLSLEEAEQAMNIIMSGEATPAQIGGYLTALRMKGETVAEIAGSAKSMRTHVVNVSIDHNPSDMLVDTCGTGGDGKHTFNISTTSAFVVAGAGIKVAKHGNRAASSKSGSADVLMALGGNLDLNAEQVGQCIDEVGIGFLYAIKHHPAMKHAIEPRRELGQRTIFNVLGPLTNPAKASHQLIGVYSPHLTEPLAKVLGTLGSESAFVVHGADGLDELSNTGVNRVSALRNGEVTTYDLNPTDFGLTLGRLDDLLGGEPAENAKMMQGILSGEDKSPRRDIVLLNAGAALALNNHDFAEGIAKAKESIDSGKALQTLNAWVEKTNSF